MLSMPSDPLKLGRQKMFARCACGDRGNNATITDMCFAVTPDDRVRFLPSLELETIVFAIAGDITLSKSLSLSDNWSESNSTAALWEFGFTPDVGLLPTYVVKS